MPALGTYLSHLREERGLSIEEMARVTRVAPRYLEALEREDFTALPAAVFTKGYIRAYCQALDVPAEEALSRYSETAESAVVTPTPTVAPTAGRTVDNDRRRSGGTLLVSFVLLVGFGLALFAVALLLQSGRPEVGAGRIEPSTPRVEPSTPRVEVEAKSVAATPAAETKAPAVTVTNTPVPVTRAPAPVTGAPTAVASSPAAVTSAPTAVTGAPSSPPASVTAGAVPEFPPLRLGGVAPPYRLVARTQEATWLRVRTEDGRATEETIPAGEVREWVSNRPFVVTIGNAAGVALELNGQKLPPLGGRGVAIFRLILPPPEP